MIDTDIDSYTLAHEQYQLLGHEGLGLTEIRIPKKGIQKFVSNEDEYVKEVLAYSKGDVYVGINPRKTQSGKTEDIAAVTCIVFDFDPIRPKDTPSTEEQHQEAIRVAAEASRDLDGMLISSGSGAHIYVPISPINIREGDSVRVESALRNYAKSIQDKYATATIRIDSTFDLPRIIRCWGSHNTKSDRPCYPLSGSPDRREFSIDRYAEARHESAPAAVAPANFDELKQRLGKVCETNVRIKRIFDGTSTYPSRSESDFALATALFRAGFNVEEVKRLLPLNPRGKAKERSERELDKEVRRIYDRVAAEVPSSQYGSQNVALALDAETYMKDLASRGPGIMTGFRKWDSMTAGLKGSRFYVDAGRPTDGKTTRLVQVAMNVAAQGHRVMLFPTEVPRSAIIDKMASARTGINLRKFQFGNFSTEERELISKALPEIMKLPLIIVENFSLRMPDIVKAIDNSAPDYVIIDFLQCMRYEDANSSSELAANVVAIKEIGKRRNIPITLASQLHRKPAEVADSMADLKGTGKLEEEGDVITFIRTVDATAYPALSNASIMKNKYGEPGVIKMKFFRSTCTFEEIDESNGGNSVPNMQSPRH